MTTKLKQRLGKLERQLGVGPETEPMLLVVCHAGCRLALDHYTCIQILREGGYVPTGPGICLVNLGDIPKGLKAEGLEKYLREQGWETCSLKGAPDPGGSARAG